MKNGKKKLQLNIKSNMQALYFKHRAKKRAKMLGLHTHKLENNGWSRLEIILEGENAQLWEMVNWAKKGPFLASVEEVVVKFEPAEVSA